MPDTFRQPWPSRQGKSWLRVSQDVLYHQLVKLVPLRISTNLWQSISDPSRPRPGESCTLTCFMKRNPIVLRSGSTLFFSLVLLSVPLSQTSLSAPKSSVAIFGFRDAAAETAEETRFLAVPDPKLAEQHLRILTQAPHVAGSPEDKATADYVAQKFREAGLDTEIVEYRVWMNYPSGNQRRRDRSRRRSHARTHARARRRRFVC